MSTRNQWPVDRSLKVAALDTSLRVVASDAINFDAELPHYGTTGGVHVGPGGRVTAPARMWMEAFDKLLLKLKVPLSGAQCACCSVLAARKTPVTVE